MPYKLLDKGMVYHYKLSFKEKIAEFHTYGSREQYTGLTEKNASIGKLAKHAS